MRWRRGGGDRNGRRRTVSSSGDSSGGVLVPPTGLHGGLNAESVNTARSASVICGGGGGGGDHTSASTTSKDELVTCPVHDCGLVCSGCENLCEHLKECHLPDCKLCSSLFLSLSLSDHNLHIPGQARAFYSGLECLFFIELFTQNSC